MLNKATAAVLGTAIALSALSCAVAEHTAAGLKKHLNLCYVDGSKDEAQTLDLFIPEKTSPSSKKSKKKSPLVVFIHGGGWYSGDKSYCPAIPLVDAGYAVASINYRLTDRGRFPTQLDDCKAAVRWLRHNASKYGYDGNKIGLWGTSAGGHLASLIGTTSGNNGLSTTAKSSKSPDQVQAVVDWYGPSDLLTFDEGHLSDVALKAVTGLLGGLSSQHKELAMQASPVYYVNSTPPPFLIVHGDQDPLVPIAQSKELYDFLKKKGTDVKLVTVPGAGHGGFGLEYVAQAKTFFDRHLKN